jgi:uncharacterized protein (TIGR01777 family)
MKIILPGGSGQVGTVLARHFHDAGHDVVVLSRRPRSASPWKVLPWDGQSLGPWARELDGADVLLNLAGRIVNCRYTWKNRCAIWASRVRSVRVLGRALEQLDVPPAVWLQAGTATIYAHRTDVPNDEISGVLGGLEEHAPDTWRFSIDVARSWEGEFALVDAPRTRKVILRSAMVMSPDRGGVFDHLLGLVRLGLGGPAGSGEQFVSWIHDQDFIRAVEFLVAREDLSGPVNLASPHPLPNAEFMRALRAAWGRGFGLPAHEWMIGLGAFFLRTESELVLKSRRVIPTRLSEAGFRFEHPDWPEAARDLCARRRARPR